MSVCGGVLTFCFNAISDSCNAPICSDCSSGFLEDDDDDDDDDAVNVQVHLSAGRYSAEGADNRERDSRSDGGHPDAYTRRFHAPQRGHVVRHLRVRRTTRHVHVRLHCHCQCAS